MDATSDERHEPEVTPSTNGDEELSTFVGLLPAVRRSFKRHLSDTGVASGLRSHMLAAVGKRRRQGMQGGGKVAGATDAGEATSARLKAWTFASEEHPIHQYFGAGTLKRLAGPTLKLRCANSSSLHEALVLAEISSVPAEGGNVVAESKLRILEYRLCSGRSTAAGGEELRTWGPAVHLKQEILVPCEKLAWMSPSTFQRGGYVVALIRAADGADGGPLMATLSNKVLNRHEKQWGRTDLPAKLGETNLSDISRRWKKLLRPWPALQLGLCGLMLKKTSKNDSRAQFIGWRVVNLEHVAGVRNHHDLHRWLVDTKEYANIRATVNISEYLGLRNDISLLGSQLRNVSESDFYDNMRTQQSRGWAFSKFQHANSENKKSRYKEAIKLYNQAIDLDPSFADAFVGRGAAFGNCQQLKKALADFNHAMRLDPQVKNGREYKEVMENKIAKRQSVV